MHRTRTGRSALRLVVPLEREAPAPQTSFCSHCGTRPTPGGEQLSRSRVCGTCSLGLLLESAAEVAPNAGDAFLVLDRSLAVCAMSRAAERLLATREPDAVNRHVTDLLMPAGAEEKAAESLSVAGAWAARGDSATRTTVVRPANTVGIRPTAPSGSCRP